MRKLENPRSIIIVTGGPGTGKSYAAARIRESISGLKVLSYDEIKEKNWDIFGFDNKAQKEAVNKFGLEEFYLYVRKAMRNSESLLLEYPFYQYHKPRLEELVQEYGYHAVTVYLYGDWKTIYERSVSRDNGGTRHPGHLTDCYHAEDAETDRGKAVDAIPTYEGFCKWMTERNYDIQIGHTIALDVTDFGKIDYDSVIDEIVACSRA